MITAKVKCTHNDPNPHDESQASLEFHPDYGDGRNGEWAKYTPALSLTMMVKAEVAAHFEQGKPYTLQFVPTED